MNDKDIKIDAYYWLNSDGKAIPIQIKEKVPGGWRAINLQAQKQITVKAEKIEQPFKAFQ